ncbi:flagellar basal-body rod protein FlgF [Chitinivorax tropicus]|uniref:Flagellar basal-body rod protein FlgF n=1 Tax=Chitinivorax tropicus TaxID=714531 RepID=A0A840MU94_9PROT|nr:flagellar basal-body rod protein FlgF [Chitinivorax tropicus]MBB5018741.1 flagellar basal-body rod protein FlgF [Chitinivorax tropicus]
MDRLIYVAMNGAKHLLLQQASTAHNLANANTPGYKAEENAFRALRVVGSPALPTRTFVVDQTAGADLTPGPIQYTGRELDVAVRDKGWLAVQTPQGEAYTRHGSFEVDAEGILRTRNGLTVVGDGGEITIPPSNRVEIGDDGVVVAIPINNPQNRAEVGRLKLVNPPERNLAKGPDGLFRTRDGAQAEADPAVRLYAGAVEASNVNAVESLVNMISHSRQYETQIKLLQTADQNARQAAQILNMS